VNYPSSAQSQPALTHSQGAKSQASQNRFRGAINLLKSASVRQLIACARRTAMFPGGFSGYTEMLLAAAATTSNLRHADRSACSTASEYSSMRSGDIAPVAA
jgi:hypothetical protein